MITFKRINNELKVEIKDAIFDSDSKFVATIPQQFDYQAELLMRQFQQQFEDTLRKKEQHYYNLGWRDAKKKNNKRQHFFGVNDNI